MKIKLDELHYKAIAIIFAILYVTTAFEKHQLHKELKAKDAQIQKLNDDVAEIVQSVCE